MQGLDKSPVAVTTPQIGEKTMAKKLTHEMIEKAIAAIKADETHETFGIRTQEIPFELGKIYHRSYVWDRGDVTDEELNGICATRIDPDPDEKPIKADWEFCAGLRK